MCNCNQIITNLTIAKLISCVFINKQHFLLQFLAPISTSESPPSPLMATAQFFSLPDSIKQLSDSGALSSVPTHYACRDPDAPSDVDPTLEGQIPTIDLSVLTEGDPARRSQMVRQLGRACEEWGFFVVYVRSLQHQFCARMLALH